MRQNTSSKQRKALASKIGRAVKQDIKMLSKEMQEILVDDLVTAFLNRLVILKRANDIEHKNDITTSCSDEAFEIVQSHSTQFQ